MALRTHSVDDSSVRVLSAGELVQIVGASTLSGAQASASADSLGSNGLVPDQGFIGGDYLTGGWEVIQNDTTISSEYATLYNPTTQAFGYGYDPGDPYYGS